MNTRKKRALSPVVASIILIAVTVAVSIAVAAWMGALTFSFTATEQLNITNMTFQVGTAATTSMTDKIANNTGTTAVTINEAWVNNVKVASANIATVPAGGLPATHSSQHRTRIEHNDGYHTRLQLPSQNSVCERQLVPVHSNSTKLVSPLLVKFRG